MLTKHEEKNIYVPNVRNEEKKLDKSRGRLRKREENKHGRLYVNACIQRVYVNLAQDSLG